MGTDWQPLHAELACWAEAGRIADFWLRDDDAIEPTAALDRLLAVCARHAIAVTLAVIPAAARRSLAERLQATDKVTVAVHGWAHENHAPANEKKEELGPHRPEQVVLQELAEAKVMIDRLFGDRALPVLVPPWNRIDKTLLPALGRLGFAAVSVYGRARPAPIRVVNTHIDPIDWHGGRGCRDIGALIGELTTELRWRREAGSNEPIGMLTHHLVHDEPVWDFLDGLLEAAATNPACRWLSARELI
ncbi:polysaccharide deacetylase family protein [Mesorhizobium sp. BAC0120]|uniref:polysaccharide deacetylase family protein n=1 Tax=Mesorhizobium sp. BAC0120 TaxID=3090670 RepID=UPI00298C772A|nr:polysaccharide deacetylase family protein [Mesorhizobium sp. BAC0120]MDW6025608.1 polysaccharide deacetylase family protein [Mesorhizobium sp. BAC0120]